MFAPLNFLGSIYSSIIQSLVDVRNLSELLTEPIEIVDVDGAQPIPIGVASENREGTISCSRCRKSLSYPATEWAFCPYCGYELSLSSIRTCEPAKGVSVQFKRKPCVNYIFKGLVTSAVQTFHFIIPVNHLQRVLRMCRSL